MLTGNRGEWSEVYALLKILSDKKLYAGNSKIQKLSNVVYPVVKVLRTEKMNDFSFSYGNTDVLVELSNNNRYLIPTSEFTANASFLLAQIKKAKKNGTFPVPRIESFINSFESYSLKAKSSVKSDITIKIHDSRTGIEPTLGFSIKSELGGDPTIFNASQATNIEYRITGPKLNDQNINRINAISTRSKIMDRVKEIQRLGCKLEYHEVDNSTFRNNLTLIDSELPKILGEAIVYYYSGITNSISDISTHLDNDNPINYDQSTGHNYYAYKLKRLLWEVALGMIPKTMWTGKYDATGGYLIVRESGDIICYHIYNKNEFEDYLFLNTRFETSSSTRNKFGSIYKSNGELYFKLNTQIRFS